MASPALLRQARRLVPGFKPSGKLPRIDWSHPLARNLKFCAFDSGAGTGMDASGNTNTSSIIDLVSGLPGIFSTPHSNPIPPAVASPVGHGLLFTSNVIGGSGGVGANDCSWSATFANYATSFGWLQDLGGTTDTRAFTMFCRWFQKEAPFLTGGYFPTLFSINDPGTGADYLDIGNNDGSPAVPGVYVGADNSGVLGSATNWNGTSYAGVNPVGSVTNLCGVVDPLYGTGPKFWAYVNGNLFSTVGGNSWTGEQNFGHVPYLTINNWASGYDYAGSGNTTGMVFQVAYMFLRALSAEENRILSDDPYCFLLWPEDEILTQLQSSGAALPPPTCPTVWFDPELFPTEWYS